MGGEAGGKECEGPASYPAAGPGRVMPGQQAKCRVAADDVVCALPRSDASSGLFLDSWLWSRFRQVGNVVCRGATQSSPSWTLCLGVRASGRPVREELAERVKEI